MCGFIAILNSDGTRVGRESLEAGADAIRHRGPDDEGFFIDGGVGLGFRRLSILDLSQKSHQPFEDDEGRYVIVFNGEIYNYLELRQELAEKGHRFRSDGDTEVLLTAYREWGRDCVERFNGMWAFVIYDRESGGIFGSRDRFGVKPLYTSRVGNRRAFASEIKALFAAEHVDRRINWSYAANYLLTGELSVPNADRETLFEDVHEVPAGHCFTVTADGAYECWSFWDLPALANDDGDSPSPELAALFQDAVDLRLRSDVPVGVCLSGGLDSTAIICGMARKLGDRRDEPLNAFSYIDEHFDETREIEATIAATRATLHRLAGNAESFLHRLGDVLWYHDEPVHSLNVLVSYELYRLAAESRVKVILNGQGADETWAGYPSYFFNHWYGLLAAGRFSRFRKELDGYCDMHEAARRELRSRTLSMLFRNQLRRSRAYRRMSAARAHRAAVADPWFTGDLHAAHRSRVPEFESLDLKSELLRSISSEPLPLYLRIEDRNSMAHSIETRLPFLDYRVVTLASRTSPDALLRGGWNKHALREATRDLIPEIVRTRPDKMGFPVSAAKWFAGPLYETTRDLISGDASRQLGLFANDRILADLEAHRKGDADHAGKLLRVVQMQMLVDGVSRPAG